MTLDTSQRDARVRQFTAALRTDRPGSTVEQVAALATRTLDA
ncbi:hypothetical protein AB0J38_26720 [Streptomyces sp. NPDC050095]